MKNNLMATILIVALAVAGLWAAFLAFQYTRYNSRANAMQTRVNEINNARNILQAIANDAVAYSQQSPSLAAMIQQFGLGTPPAAAAAAPAKPAPAPAAQPKAAPKTSTSKK